MQKSVLFISHEMSRTGAPIMILQAAKALKKAGFLVSVITYSDGPLEEEFTNEGIKVVVNEGSMNDSTELLLVFGKIFDLVIINTIVCTGAVKTFLNQDIPIFWWIHEGTTVLPSYKKFLPESLSSNFHVYCVSNYTRSIFLQLGPTYEANVLYNGVEEISNYGNKEKTYNPNRFICVGSIEERKGQDLILYAIDELFNNGVNDLEFIFVGQILSESIREKLEIYCKKYNFIKVYPTMPRRKVFELMASSVAVLVPSRDDPGPLVASEAMMLGKPVVVTKCTGTADLITDGDNGFIIESNNVEALVDKILLIRDNPTKAAFIGERGRDIYNQYYSIDKFNANFLAIVNKLINPSGMECEASKQEKIIDEFCKIFSYYTLIHKENKVLIKGLQIVENIRNKIANSNFWKAITSLATLRKIQEK